MNSLTQTIAVGSHQETDFKLVAPRHKQNIVLGVVFAILGAISFTLMSLFGKFIGEKASIDTILFARFAISLVLVIPWATQNWQDVIKVDQPLKFLIRSLFTLLSLACFFYSLKFISLANALLLNNTAPLFVPLVALISMGVKTSHKVLSGIVLGFVGIALVLNPTQQFFDWASFIGLLSGVFAAMGIVAIRSLTKMASIVQILFYNFLICSIFTGLILPLDWKAFDFDTGLLLFGLGLCGAAYQFFSTLSYAKAPVRLMSSFMFLCIVFGVLVDFVLWRQIPSLLTSMGMMLVIIGGALTIYLGKREMASTLGK